MQFGEVTFEGAEINGFETTKCEEKEIEKPLILAFEVTVLTPLLYSYTHLYILLLFHFLSTVFTSVPRVKIIQETNFWISGITKVDIFGFP